MTDADWTNSCARCLGMGLPGDQIEEVGERGERLIGNTFVILLNANSEAVPFRLGARRRDVSWVSVIDTGAPGGEGRTYDHMSVFPLEAHAMAVLKAVPIPT